MPRLQRESYSPQDFPTELRSQSAQCRALGQHQTAIVTPFWVRGSARFAKRTAPSGGMREMCINNIIHHGPTEFCRCLQPDKCLYHLNLAVDQDFLQYVDKATAALDGDFHQYDQEERTLRWVATTSSESEVGQFFPLLAQASWRSHFRISKKVLHRCTTWGGLWMIILPGSIFPG